MERLDATMALRQQIAAWEEAGKKLEAGKKFAEKEPENLDNSENSVIFAQTKDGKPTRMSFNLTQNAGEGTGEGATNRLDEKNEADRVAYRDALNTLRNEEATDEERTAAEATITQIEAKRKAQMTQLAQEALKGVEGVRLVGVEEGTGVYLGENGEVIEYTSVVEVEVEEGREAAAIAAMAAVAETTKQDSYIVNYPTEGNTVYGVPKSYGKEWQKPSPAAQVVVPLNKPLTQRQKAILTKAFIDAGLGVTITDKEISTSNFTFESDEEFNAVVDDILNSFKNGNAETEISEQGGNQSLQGESVVQGETGSGLSHSLDLGEPEYRTNYSHYNEARKNGNDRDYTTVARTDANWEHAGDQSIYEQEEGSSALRVPQTDISREDILQRLQTVYEQTEEAMSSPVDAVVPTEEGSPSTRESGEEASTPSTEDTTGSTEWEPDEEVNLEDDDVVVLLHYTREHYPLVKIARVTEEDGKKVYHEIGKEGKIIDAEKGNWQEMEEKKIVEDENGVEYLFIDFDGRAKRRGIPLIATNEQLEAINQQNRAKATGLRGLTELKQAPKTSATGAKEELSSMEAALEKPLIKASGTEQTLSLLDILSLRPRAVEVTEMTKDKDGNEVPTKRMVTISIWQQIAQICDKMARDSQATTNKKYGKQADELQIAEQAALLLQDFKQTYKRQLEAWNKLVRKNNIDQLIAKHIDKIDPELVETYRALYEKIYRKPQEGNPSAVVQTNFNDSRLFKNVDDNIFRFMQVVADMTRQACDAANRIDKNNAEDILEMAVQQETPWRVTSNEAKKKAGGKTIEDIKKEIKKEILDSLDLDNIHSAEEIRDIKQRVGKMKKLFEDKEFTQDYWEKVQLAEEKYGRTDEIEETPEKKAKKKAKAKDKGDEMKTTQLALAAAQKKGDTERVQKLQNRLNELQGEEAAAADAEAEAAAPEQTPTQAKTTPETPEERQKRYDQLRAQRDYFWEQRMKAHKEGDTAAENTANEMIQRIDEELDKMDEEAEMQQGQSVMPNATPAQRFVTNVVLKALKNIKGITVHNATQADIERMRARLKERKAEADGGNLSGKFEQDESQSAQKTEPLTTSDGTVYGWSIGNEIWLTEEGLNPETPIHEYVHLWAKALKRANPKEWGKIVRLCKANKALWESVANDPNYQHLKGNEDAIASEVLSRYSGKRGAQRMLEEAAQMEKDSKSFESDVESKLFVSRLQNALRSLWGWVRTTFGLTHYKSLEDVADMSLYNLLDGRNLELGRTPTTFDKKFQKMVEGLDKGGSRVLSLQQISELTDALENDLRQGNKPLLFERVPFEALQGLLESQRELAETLTIVAGRSRRQSRAVERSGGEVTSDEIISRDGSNTQMMLDLVAYAKEKGFWIEDVVDALDKRYGKENRMRGGAESEVWADKANGRVIKAKVTDYYETAEEFLEGMLLNNWIFGGNEQRIIGIGIDRRGGKDGIRIVYETPYVDMQETTPLTQEEKDEFMQNYGFEKVDSETLHKDKGESSKYTNGNFTIGDLHSMNIVRDSEGNIRCTDPIIRWEQGEHYRPQTEEEVEQDAANEERLDAIFDGEEIEAQIESGDISKVDLAAEMYVKEQSQ